MAERRMFAKTIIDSDAFIDMPVTARLLYYDLAMRADDDGFVNSPKKIMRMIGASSDDMNILVMRKFIIPFDNGIVVIKHWRIHNYIRQDTYKETTYKEERSLLELDENKAYRMIQNTSSTDRPRLVDGSSTQDSIGKDSIGQDRLGKDSVRQKAKPFTPPTVEDVREYCLERCNNVDPERFVNYYESIGWKVGKHPMKDWKATVRSWEKKDSQRSNRSEAEETSNPFLAMILERGGSVDDLERHY